MFFNKMKKKEIPISILLKLIFKLLKAVLKWTVNISILLRNHRQD